MCSLHTWSHLPNVAGEVLELWLQLLAEVSLLKKLCTHSLTSDYSRERLGEEQYSALVK